MIDLRHAEWVLERQKIGKMFDGPVMIMGEGPMTPRKIEKLLSLVGAKTARPSGIHWILVLGREDWDETELDDLIESRAGQLLYCYSQEMLMTALLSGIDPYQTTADDVALLGEGHPALEYLSKQGFEWPHVRIDTAIESDESSEGIGGWGDGPLGILGYSVRSNGPATSERRRILSRMFELGLNELFDRPDFPEWGRARTNVRLSKIASSIAGFHNRYRKRYGAWTPVAERWRSDLEWLKKTYYPNVKRFAWPKAYVD
jgi:hypothetical protein